MQRSVDTGKHPHQPQRQQQSGKTAPHEASDKDQPTLEEVNTYESQLLGESEETKDNTCEQEREAERLRREGNWVKTVSHDRSPEEQGNQDTTKDRTID